MICGIIVVLNRSSRSSSSLCFKGNYWTPSVPYTIASLCNVRPRQATREGPRETKNESVTATVKGNAGETEKRQGTDAQQEISYSGAYPISSHALFYSFSRSHMRSSERSAHLHHRHRYRTPSDEPPRKHQRHEGKEREKDRQKAVSDFVDEIAKEQQQKKGNNNNENENKNKNGDAEEEDEMEMKKLGIPVDFDSTKGEHVPGAGIVGVRAVYELKRQV